MNREIKFRAWDGKEMSVVETLWFQYSGKDWHIPGKKQCKELMQYTGLKDKNGVEIYSGDIVKGVESEQDCSNKRTITGQVYSRRGGITLFNHAMSDYYYQEDDRIKRVMWRSPGSLNTPETWYQITDIEVIGNIYQHPELLTQSIND